MVYAQLKTQPLIHLSHFVCVFLFIRTSEIIGLKCGFFNSKMDHASSNLKLLSQSNSKTYF